MTVPRLVALALLSALTVPGAGLAEPPKPVTLPKFDPDKLADPKEAARAVKVLEEEYPEPRPEAVRMLMAILKGSQLDGTDGWFGPAQTRYTWPWLAKRHDLDPKERASGVAADTFRGPKALFEALDRDGDGRITAGDLDWSDRNPWVMRANLLTGLFRRWDGDGDGELTRAELDALFKRVAGNKNHFTADDFRRALMPRGPAGFAPGDGPTVPVLVRGLYAGEIGSIQEGPRLGAAAPDFELKTRDGQETVRLSKLIGPKPVVLVFGNFTCGPFRALAADVGAIARRYKGDATFVMVYVREAHPTDGWVMQSNTRSGVAVKQPTTYGERVTACGLFSEKLKPSFPVLVDEIDDRVGNAYSGMPGRLYVIDRDGKVAYKSGRGPFGFRAGELEQALVMNLVEAAPAEQPKPAPVAPLPNEK